MRGVAGVHSKPRDVRQSDNSVVCWHCGRSAREIGDLSAVARISDLFHHPARTRDPPETREEFQ
jgi:hypothetical protein